MNLEDRQRYARRVLADHAAACRSAGVAMPLPLQALLVLLESPCVSKLDSDLQDDDALLVTFDRAAKVLSVSRPTVYRLVASGALRAVKVAGDMRIARADLVAYVDNLLDVR